MIWRRIHVIVDDGAEKIAVVLECEHTIRVRRVLVKNLRTGARVPCSHCSAARL